MLRRVRTRITWNPIRWGPIRWGVVLILALVLPACGAPAGTTVTTAPIETPLPAETSAATMEATTEATMEVTTEGTMEATTEATAEGTMEATTEATTETAETVEVTGTAEVAGTPEITGTAETMPGTGETLKYAETADLGTILVDSAGMTLYTFKNDTPGTSNCTGTCITNWPPLTVTEGTVPTLPSDITGTLDVITRPDDGMQVRKR
ncbi:MAG: hypothetical protein M1546_22485 [Chloroflexi bacterium]|nr:hypothetical protein [Chloroflexota bacterium]